MSSDRLKRARDDAGILAIGKRHAGGREIGRIDMGAILDRIVRRQTVAAGFDGQRHRVFVEIGHGALALGARRRSPGANQALACAMALRCSLSRGI